MNIEEGDKLTGTAGDVAPGVLVELAGTRIWVRLATLAVVLLIVLTVVNTGLTMSGAFGPAVMGAALIPNVLSVLLYVAMGALLHGYASALGRASASGASADVEAALAQNRLFWKIGGIVTLVLITVGILAGIAAVIYAVVNRL